MVGQRCQGDSSVSDSQSVLSKCLVFTVYALISTTFTNGICSTTRDPSITPPTSYSVSEPTTVSTLAADFDNFPSSAEVELDAQQNRYKMEANCRSLEMEGEDECQEMVGEETRLQMPSLGRLHELRGEKHAKELDTSHVEQRTRRYHFHESTLADPGEFVLTLQGKN